MVSYSVICRISSYGKLPVDGNIWVNFPLAKGSVLWANYATTRTYGYKLGKVTCVSHLVPSNFETLRRREVVTLNYPDVGDIPQVFCRQRQIYPQVPRRRDIWSGKLSVHFQNPTWM